MNADFIRIPFYELPIDERTQFIVIWYWWGGSVVSIYRWL